MPISPEMYMQRCHELAAMGLGHTATNPLVGAVVVHSERIIGEGFHQQYGGPHAEVMAIAGVKDQTLLREATLYVNLEPCSHHGKTPPCTDLILKSGIGKVVVGNLDPFEGAAGRGVQTLKAGGVEVITGILEDEGRWLNRRFFTKQEKSRPYVILKWAQTLDGFIDKERTPESGVPPLKITCEASDRLVHKWRTEETAILIGKNTAAMDNPSLTARLWPGQSPVRVVIDPRLELSPDLKIFKDGNPTWIFSAMKQSTDGSLRYFRIDDPENFHREIIATLNANGIQSVIVEGGAGTIQRFYDDGLWDEARIFYGPIRAGGGVRTPTFIGRLLGQENVGRDLLQYYTPA